MLQENDLQFSVAHLYGCLGENVVANDYADNRQAITFACYHHPRLRRTHQMSRHESRAASDVSASAARQTPPTPPPVEEHHL